MPKKKRVPIARHHEKQHWTVPIKCFILAEIVFPDIAMKKERSDMDYFFRIVITAVVVAAVSLWSASSLRCADIYMYVDEEGIYNFTDQPTSDNYQLFIKDWHASRSSALRTSQFDEYIEAAARKHGIETHLLKAVVKAESNFNPRAVSNKGALGLMQIMPENITRLNITDPFDPRENIMGGARFLRELLNRFNGNVHLALAAYNAGPGNVERSNSIPPIPETENFVQKVLMYYRNFKHNKETPQ